ncbi:MAG: ABC transporter ATP-binding protein [Chloroflexi bacterium]|nr:ABC transporter ATP-binding protein [Chloroflexota bacterium]
MTQQNANRPSTQRAHGSAPAGAPQSTTAQRRPGPGRGGPGRGVPMGLMRGEKARDFKGTMRKLIAYLGSYRIAILIVMLVAAGSTVFNIVSPKILGRATTRLFENVAAMISGTGTGVDFDYIGRVLLTVLALYLASALLGYVQGWVMAGVSTDIAYRLRRDISEKVNRMPLRYFDGTSHGEVLSRLTNDVDTVNNTLSQSLSQMITSVVTVIGVLVMMLTISWQMTLAALLILPLSAGAMAFVVTKSQKFFRAQQEYLGHVNGHVEEMYGGHLVVKAFNGEAESLERFDGLNRELYSSAWKSQFLTALIFPVMGFIGNIGYVVVCVVGAWLATQGLITVGNIQAFIQYVRSFTQPITQIGNISNILQQTAAAAERVFEFMEEDEEVPDTDKPAILDGVQGHVEFDHVHFGYSPDKTIINDFSAEARPGQRIAIVGPTGAGKTTMVKLLMRFYDVDQGAIRVDGHSIKDLRRADLRCMFGMVLQDTWLYNDTIRENIRYGHPSATDEEVVAAAQAARVDHFVRTLPEGYDLVLNEEATNLSQGEKQLLTIARAFLVDPRMLILDEATSSVDTRTEVLIQEAMGELMQGRTSFIIAHRLSTIRGADLILVMNEGDIVEQGTHEDLLARGGFYADMYNAQFEGSAAGN